MCMTSARARLSNTLIYTGTAHRQGKDVHVLAYQNTAYTSGPNAMILPVSTSDAMDEKNVIDTRSFKGFLKDITNASKVQSRMLGGDSRVTRSAKSAQVFDVGSYTVVLADNAFQIPEALNRVPDHKRPNVSSQFLIGFNKLYTDRPIAVCCWDGHLKAEPLLWWYVPTNKDVLFAPTMDAHDGSAPNVDEVVETDHIISVGSASLNKVGHHNRVIYNDSIPADVQQLLPTHTYGMKINSHVKNGDMFVDANRLGHEKLYKDIPQIMRGTQFDPNANAWEMYGWS